MQWDPLEDKLRGMLQEFFEDVSFDEDYEEAKSVYGINDEEDEGEWRLFNDWYIHDYVTSEGRTIIKLFLEEKSSILNDVEKATVVSWSDSAMRFLEVTELKPGIGYLVKDALDSSLPPYFVHDASSSKVVAKYDIIFARPYKVGTIVRLASGGFTLPHRVLGSIKEYVKSGMCSMDTKDLDAYLRANSLALVKYTDSLRSLSPTVVTREGDMIVLASSEYRIRDVEMVSRLLDSSNDFRHTGSEGGAEHYDWVSQIGAIAVPGNQNDDDAEIVAVETFLLEEGGSEFNILGSLTLEMDEGALKIECISDQRLELCKRAVEELLGEFVSHALDKYTDVESIVSKAAEPETSIGNEKLDKVEERMSLDFFERYHEKWLNTKIKSLGNMTPLEASRTDEGKRNLEEIFKDYENMIAREEQSGDELQTSFLKLRDKLGL